MSKYRHIYTELWKDIYIKSLTRDEKITYLYLLTNPDTKQCGIYVFDFELCQSSLSLNKEELLSILNKFLSDNKIKINFETFEIAIRNWNSWNKSESPKVARCIGNELEGVADKKLINYCYTNDELYRLDKILIESYKKLKSKKKYISIFCQYYKSYLKILVQEDFELIDYLPDKILREFKIEKK